MDDRWFREVAQVFIQFDRLDLALQIAAEDIGRLNVMVRILGDSGQSTESVDKVRRRVVFLLEQECRKSDPPAWALAGLCLSLGR